MSDLRLLATVAVLVSVVLAVWIRIVGQDFVLWDDDITVYQNQYLNPVSWQHILHFWRQPFEQLYIPLSYTVYSFLAGIAALPQQNLSVTNTGALLDPHVFHAAGLALHVANTLLVFFMLRRLVARDLPAAAGALLFALHPLQAESVAWVSELRGELCAGFSLIAILLYLAFAGSRQGNSARPAVWWYAGALLAVVAAMLCKPTAGTLPLILIVFDHILTGRSWRDAAAPVVPMLAVSLVILVVTQGAQPVDAYLRIAWWDRPFVAGDALAFYLVKLFLPVHLAIDYGRAPASVLDHWWGYLTWLLPAALAVLIWARRAIWPWLAPAALISLLALLPNLGLIPFTFQGFSTVADRYTYLALLGPAVVLARALSSVKQPVLLGIAGTVLVVFGALSAAQAGVWANTRTLMTHEVAVNADSYAGNTGLGLVLASAGDMPGAIAHFERAIHALPTFYTAHIDLAHAYAAQGWNDRAVAEYRRALRIAPDSYEAHFDLATTLDGQGRSRDAFAEYQAASRIAPMSPSPYFNTPHAHY